MNRKEEEKKRRREEEENTQAKSQKPETRIAFWHRVSFDRFLRETLPQLLVSRLPLAGYRVEAGGEYTCRVTVTVEVAGQTVAVTYDDVPQPDAEGFFDIGGRAYVVLPTASTDDLEIADILCVGEQLQALCVERLGDAPADLAWENTLLRNWLPLDAWIRDYVKGRGQALAPPDWQPKPSWIERNTLPRRLLLPEGSRMFTAGHFGRTCPLESPEGANIGRILVVASGAEIRDGKLVIVEDSPLGGLGMNACLIPFLENCDPCRLVMSVNMMRQWVPPPDPEPALIQTGGEPNDAPDFWCGRNLLTAYVSGGIDTFEDGILVSQSCALRLSYPFDALPGDKLSNRYGNKGVISRILPDDDMPHLLETDADGTERRTPVELVFSPMSLYSRMTFGQVREAVLSVVAQREGRPLIVPPFAAPNAHELRERIAGVGLPADGMRTLTQSRHGALLPVRSTVGWVYWGRLNHVAQDKLHVTASPAHCPRLGQPEYQAMALASVTENIRDAFNTRSAGRADADTLAARLAAGPLEQASPPAPQWEEVMRRLSIGGVQTQWTETGVMFRIAAGDREALTLAEPMPHPWNPETTLHQIGVFPELLQYGALAEANGRLARMLASQAPESLLQTARTDLQARMNAFFTQLLRPEHLEFGAKAQFSGRAVAAIGGELNYDQMGLPDEIAWTLFAPLVTREIGDASAVQARTEQAAQTLDSIMARSWVLLNRAPTLMPTGILAFHPVRIPDPVIRVHPFACALMELDFDGDLASTFLPVTDAAQREAGEKLTIVGHLKRDLGLMTSLLPLHDARLGLAHLSLTPEGRAEIERLAGTSVALQDGLLTRAALEQPLYKRLLREGEAAVVPILDGLHRLTHLGFETTRTLGAGYGPFFGMDWPAPAKPDTDDPDVWNAYLEEFAAHLTEWMHRLDALRDPVLLTLKSGARGGIRLALKIAGTQGVVAGLDGTRFAIRHGYGEGLTPEEFAINCIGTREGMARVVGHWFDMQKERMQPTGPVNYGVIARAMRAPHPGIVFARAAAAGETDVLESAASRLFVGR